MVYGINETQNSALAARGPDLVSYINDHGGSFVCLGQSSLTSAYTWLPSPLVQVGLNNEELHSETSLIY